MITMRASLKKVKVPMSVQVHPGGSVLVKPGWYNSPLNNLFSTHHGHLMKKGLPCRVKH
jgi:hypothetical protein